MTTITTTPAPQVGRTPLLVGIAAVGIVAVSVVAVPRLTATFDTTGTTTATTNQHDAVEHGRDAMVFGALAAERARVTAAEARTSAQVQRTLDLQGKQRTDRGTAASLVPASTTSQQVGGQQGSYAYTPSSVALTPSTGGLAAPKRGHVGATLLEIPTAVVAPMVAGSAVREQIGGLAPTFPYSPPSTRSGVDGRDLVQVPASTSHTVWSDTFVPPYDDPEWLPLIERHYGITGSTSPATHEYR